MQYTGRFGFSNEKDEAILSSIRGERIVHSLEKFEEVKFD